MEAIVYTTKGGSTMDAIKNIIIRLETKEDYRAVENLTRESFWNVYRPGCMEHYGICAGAGFCDGTGR